MTDITHMTPSELEIYLDNLTLTVREGRAAEKELEDIGRMR